MNRDRSPSDASGPDFDGADLGGLPPGVEEKTREFATQAYVSDLAAALGQVPRPINWRTLPPGDLEHELLELNGWVDWLRHTYGLPAQVIPPTWHRHPELLWELSALRQHWLFCFDPQTKGNQALAWHHDYQIARERLRNWVTISGTRLDRDRPNMTALTELFVRFTLAGANANRDQRSGSVVVRPEVLKPGNDWERTG